MTIIYLTVISSYHSSHDHFQVLSVMLIAGIVNACILLQHASWLWQFIELYTEYNMARTSVPHGTWRFWIPFYRVIFSTWSRGLGAMACWLFDWTSASFWECLFRCLSHLQRFSIHQKISIYYLSNPVYMFMSGNRIV